jgi:hypothetical protein
VRLSLGKLNWRNCSAEDFNGHFAFQKSNRVVNFVDIFFRLGNKRSRSCLFAVSADCIKVILRRRFNFSAGASASIAALASAFFHQCSLVFLRKFFEIAAQLFIVSH